MNSFANEKVSAEKESAVSNLRKEIAFKHDSEVKALLNEVEYAQYIQDLDNDRELTFKGKNVMDYSENEINLIDTENKEKIRKLKILQLKIKSQMIRAYNEERNRKIEEERRRENEQRKSDEELQTMMRQDEEELNKEKEINKTYPIKPINIIELKNNVKIDDSDDELYSKKYLSLRKEKDYKKLYTKYKYKYLKLKGKLN